MATPTANARASRRAAAMRAAAETPVEAEVVSSQSRDVADDEEAAAIEAAFGNGGTLEGSGSTEAPTPVSQAQAAASALVRPSVARTAIALPMRDLTREIDAGDLVMPKLRQSQAMSKVNTLFATSKGTQGVGMGNWYITSTGRNLGDTVYFVPVDMRKSRAMFVQGQGLMCRSFDLVQGEGDPGILCDGTFEEQHSLPEAQRGCAFRLWNDKVPPKCGVTYNYPGIVILDIDNPRGKNLVQCIMQLRSSSTSAAKQINTIVMNDGMGVWQNVILELGTEVRTNTKGQFFVPEVNSLEGGTEAAGFEHLKRRADAMATQMGSANLRASIEDDAD